MSREDALRALYPEQTTPAPARRDRPKAAAPARTGLDLPEKRRDGDEFVLTWPALGVGIGVTHLHERGDGLNAEVTIEAGVAGHIHWGTLNLASTAARETLVKKLDNAHPGTPWRQLLDHTCRTVADAFRAGAPVVILRPKAATEARFLVEKMMPAGETTVLFGDGGAGKSLFALALAVAVTKETALPAGLRSRNRANVLYLDWESGQEVHEDRLHGLLAGLGIDEAQGLYYRPMHRALADDIQRLRTEVSRHGIGLVIVDSYGGACGAEPETADSAIRLMNALRSFGSSVTRLVIAHVSKASADQRTGSSRPFGSVYVQNLARSVWEARKPDDDGGDTWTLGLYHRKVNQGRLFPPIGIKVTFESGVIRLGAQDLADEPDLLARTSLTFRIRHALRDGARTPSDLASEVKGDKESVGRTLRRLLKQGKVVKLDDVKGGRTEAQWGLAHPS